jgi:predicted AlkP superfamily phosphohydrolase/phosphomutase
MRRGTPIWEALSSAGIPSTVLRLPCTYPPDPIKGKMLAGVGVPDLRGGLGTGTYYTSQPGVPADHSERVVHVPLDGGKKLSTVLIGPRHPKTRSDVTSDITLELDRVTRKITIYSDGQPNALEIQEGKWSSWLRVRFKMGMLQAVQGMVRFYLRSVEPQLELYASPVNFDPQAPLFPISAPAEYAAELQARIGNYYTVGMAEDHDGLNNERFDENAFWVQSTGVLRERERMMLFELERLQEGFFFCLFDTPDRLQHMLWRGRVPGHPANSRWPLQGDKLARAIQEHYKICDTVVGKAMEFAGEDTLFAVLSDHGMNRFERGLHLNTWLWQNGFLALKNGSRPEDDSGEFFHNVDWSRTQAYSLGLGCIYLNLKDREEQGIVPPEDAGRVKAALAKSLTGLCDEARGEVAVRSVLAREQIYQGAYAEESPDLVVNFAEGYRVSWETPLGGVPAPGPDGSLFADNHKKWGGDHVIDPALVPGVLFMNRPFRTESPSLVDLAPTILAALGVPKTPAMEGRDLLS